MPLIESEEAARRLGIKLSTLYAYVSRGTIRAHRATDTRRSLFELEDVEALARRARGGKQIETRLATIHTSVTHLDERGPSYRGVLATELCAERRPFEAVAERLW